MATTLIALAGISIDVGMAYRQKAAMQSAADAAALAACIQLPDTQTPSKCLSEARALASLNGYTDGVNGCTVTGMTAAAPASSFEVTISQPYNTLFVWLAGARTISMNVLARAKYFALSPVSIDGGMAPGQAGNIAILTMFGPWALHEYGDMYSTRYTNSGALNPTYQPNGLDFAINVPANYVALTKNAVSSVQVDIFDPNTDVESSPNQNMNQSKSKPPNVPTPFPNPPIAPGSASNDVTQYSLFKPASPSSNDLTMQTPINQFQEGSDTVDSQQWVNPAGWTFDTAATGFGTGKYRINVRTMDGSGRNGFSLRAGPPGMDWNVRSGAHPNGLALDAGTGLYRDLDGNPALSITANGRLPLAFHNSSGGNQTATISLGGLPAANIDYRVHIGKFDTDVGAVSVTYQDDGNHAQSDGTLTSGSGPGAPGTLAGNDQYAEDVLTAKVGYPGGQLRALYTAGSDDTSCWEIYFEGQQPGQPGKAHLVQ